MLKKSPLRSRNRRSLVRQVGDRAKITGRLLEMPLAYPRYNKDADTIDFYTDSLETGGEVFITSVSVESMEETINAVVSLAKSDTTPEVNISLVRDGYWGVIVHKRFEDFPQILIQRLEQYQGKELPDLAPDRVYSTDIGHVTMLVVTRAEDLVF
jgi:hypothetical protein